MMENDRENGTNSIYIDPIWVSNIPTTNMKKREKKAWRTYRL